VPLGIEEARISTKFNTLTGEFSIPEMEAVRMIYQQGLKKNWVSSTKKVTNRGV
jgi:hypothetical protein